MLSPQRDSPNARAASRADIDHIVRNPLMIIWGRTHLMKRTIQQDAMLTEVQTTPLLRDLAAIDAAVVTLVTDLDALGP